MSQHHPGQVSTEKSILRLVLFTVAASTSALSADQVSAVSGVAAHRVASALQVLVDSGWLVRRGNRHAVADGVPEVRRWAEAVADEAFEPDREPAGNGGPGPTAPRWSPRGPWQPELEPLMRRPRLPWPELRTSAAQVRYRFARAMLRADNRPAGSPHPVNPRPPASAWTLIDAGAAVSVRARLLRRLLRVARRPRPGR